MPQRSADWTVTPINPEPLPTPLSPSSSCRNVTTIVHVPPQRQSSAMPESATLPPSRWTGNSISHTQPLHGFSRASLASIRGREGDDVRRGGPLKESGSSSSLSTTGSGRLNGTARNRSASSNNVVGMNHARKTIRRAQAMGLITTMPFSLSSPSPSTPSDSLSSSTFSSVPTSRNGSIADPGAGETLGIRVGDRAVTVVSDDESGTPKAGSTSRLASATPAVTYSPFSQRHIRRQQFESSSRPSEGPFDSPQKVGDVAGGYDGGMVASTGWLITVVPPDSLYYALNSESSMSPEPPTTAQHNDVTNAPRTDESKANDLDKVLSAARLNKWRKGKILPLVPDLKGMMKSIGREWNLPSEIGMEVFLASGRISPHGTRDAGTEAEDGGMDGMLSEETWRMIWMGCVAEAEAARITAQDSIHNGQPFPSQPVNQRDVEAGRSETVHPQQIQSPIEMSPSMTEPPLTGNTFGTASDLSSESLHEMFVGQGMEDLPQSSHQSRSDHQRQSSSNHSQAVASHAGTLTPASSQTSFGPGAELSITHDLPVPAAQALLSPSPSSVFPGASSSQYASPPSVQRSQSNMGFTQRRVLGRIEFDFDSSTGRRGEWYAAWLKRKVQTRQGWTQPDSAQPRGLKPLRLGTRTTESPLSENGDDEESLHDEAQMEYAPLMDEEESDSQYESNDRDADADRSSSVSATTSLRNEGDEAADPEVDRLVSHALATTFPEGSDDFVNAFTTGQALGDRHIEPQATYTWKDIGSSRILDNRVTIEQLGTPPATEFQALDDVAEVHRMMDENNTSGPSTELLVPARNQLLASPIDLASPNVDRDMQPPPILVAHPDVPLAEPALIGQPTVHGLGMGIQMDDGEKRGSALVISSQLDILEKALRDLSPRDIRFSVFPSLMAPSESYGEEMPVARERDVDVDSVGDYAVAPQRFSDASEDSVQESIMTVDSEVEANLPRTAELKTPALESDPIFARTPDPHAPYPKFTPRSAPDGTSPIPLSLDSMMRMEYQMQHGLDTSLPKKSPGWTPRRPARPPSPHLEQYTAPSPHLKLSDTPPPATMTVIDTRGLSKSPEEPIVERPRVASAGSKGMNKLNRLFNRRVSEKSADDTRGEVIPPPGPIDLPDYGTTAKSPKPNDSFGRRLFKGLHVKSPSSAQEAFSTSIISDPVVVSTTNKQAYQLSQLQQQQASPPSSSAIPPVPPKVVPFGAPGGTNIMPSSPSLDTLHTARFAQPPFGTPTIPTSPSLNTIFSGTGQLSSPNSPACGGAVKRKPVPRRQGDDALPTSQSVHSMTSFVLEDAPRRTKKGG